MIETRLHYHKYLRLWYNLLIAIQIFLNKLHMNQILSAWLWQYVLTISAKLQLLTKYENQNKQIEKLCGYSDNFKFKTSLEFKIEAKPSLGSSQL